MGKSELAGSNSVLTVVRSSGITTALIEHSLEYVSLQSFFVPFRGEEGKKGRQTPLDMNLAMSLPQSQRSFVEADRQRRERESSSLLEVVTDEVYCDRSAQ